MSPIILGSKHQISPNSESNCLSTVKKSYPNSLNYSTPLPMGSSTIYSKKHSPTNTQ